MWCAARFVIASIPFLSINGGQPSIRTVLVTWHVRKVFSVTASPGFQYQKPWWKWWQGNKDLWLGDSKRLHPERVCAEEESTCSYTPITKCYNLSCGMRRKKIYPGVFLLGSWYTCWLGTAYSHGALIDVVKRRIRRHQPTVEGFTWLITRW